MESVFITRLMVLISTYVNLTSHSFFAYMCTASIDSIFCQVAEPMHTYYLLATTLHYCRYAMLSVCTGSLHNTLYSYHRFCLCDLMEETHMKVLSATMKIAYMHLHAVLWF